MKNPLYSNRLLKTLVGTIFVFLVILAICLGTGTGSVANAIGSAENSEEDPYEISDGADLKELADYVFSGGSTRGRYYKLTGDVVIDDPEFVGIGDYGAHFAGSFDGNGFSIEVNITAERDYVGLFGYLESDAVVKNLNVKGSVTGRNYVGGIAAYNGGTIVGCVNDAKISTTAYEVSSGDVPVGETPGGEPESGISLYDLQEVATVVGSYVGGISGWNVGKISQSMNIGAVKANDYVGGIAGRNLASGRIEGVVNVGSVEPFTSASSVRGAGGLVGENAGGLSDSYNNGAVTVTGSFSGAALGYVTGLAEGSENVRNVSDRSGKSFYGRANMTLPTTFGDITEKKIMLGEATFGSLVIPEEEEGYAFLPEPDFMFADFAADYFRRSLFGRGTGEELSPFEITDSDVWRLFVGNAAKHSYSGKFVKVNADISSAATIKNAGIPFLGNFDGGNRTLTLSESAPLFEEIGAPETAGTRVGNLNIIGNVSGENNVGLLAGKINGGKAENVNVSGSVTGFENVGSVCGYCAGELSNVTSDAAVSGTRNVGGVVGNAENATGDRLVFKGTISMNSAGQSFAYFGGIAGSASGTFRSVFVKANTTAANADYVGGIFGNALTSEIAEAAVLGNVFARYRAGGIAGYCTGSITSFMVVGNISASGNLGGVLGCGSAVVEDGYFRGNVTANSTAGTLVGLTGDGSDEIGVSSGAYYDSDILNGFSGTFNGAPKSGIELTELKLDDLFGDSWTTFDNIATGAYFPVITSFADLLEGENAVFYSYFSRGAGVSGNSFMIQTETEFRNFSHLVNGYSRSDYYKIDYASAYYRLGADITFTSELPTTDGFSGFFNGANRKLENVSYEGDAMFNTLKPGATVYNLALESGTARSASVALTVENGATVRSCYSRMIITFDSPSSVGGIAAVNGGRIEGCVYGGQASAKDTYVGGIAGLNNKDGEIISCFTYARLNVSGSYGFAGGIAGQNAGKISHCTVAGVINGDSNHYIGGLAGRNMEGGSYSRCVILTRLVHNSENTPIENRAGFVAGESTVTDSTIEKIYFAKTYNPTLEDSDWAGIMFIYSNDGTARKANGGEMIGMTPSELSSDNALAGQLTEEGVAAWTKGRAEGMDSAYCPMVNLPNAGERLAELALYATRIRLFGWDVNLVRDDAGYVNEWGTESSPYFITDPDQLVTLMRKVNEENYEYSGKYFTIRTETGVLDLTGKIMQAIGRYYSNVTSTRTNRMFDGTFDGNGHTITGLNISYNSGYDGYVGLFAYVGQNGVIKNLTLDENCDIMSTVNTPYAAGLAGYLRGKIDNCLVRCSIVVNNSVTAYAAGIAGVCAPGAAITNCVFDGELTADIICGITSTSGGSNGSFATNTWYIAKNSGEFVRPNEESYVPTGDGKTLYVDREGEAVPKREGGKIVIELKPANAEERPVIMNSSDVAALEFSDSSEWIFDPTAGYTDGMGASRYYLRFTYEVTAAFTNAFDGETAAEEALANSGYNAGYYYRGQTVTFGFLLKEGYFIDFIDIKNSPMLPEGLNFSSSNNVVNIQFIAPEEVAEGSYAIPVTIDMFSRFGTMELAADDVYDGKVKAVEFRSVSEDRTFTMTPSYTYGADAANRASITEAGNYRVRANMAIEGVYCGYLIKNITILPKTIAPKESADWKTFAEKKYDGRTVNQKNVPSEMWKEAFEGLTESALSSGATAREFAIIATITYDGDLNVGEKNAVITFALSGTQSGNYKFEEGAKIEVAASVTYMTVNLTVEEENLTSEFRGRTTAPRINFSFDAAYGSESDLVWKFTRVGGGSDGTYNVGKYVLTVSHKNANYKLVLNSGEEVIFEITPYIVNDVTYEIKNNVYVPEKNDLVSYFRSSDRVRASYMVGGTTYLLDLDFYIKVGEEMQKLEDTEVINAGTYYIKPVTTDGNFALSEEAGAYYEFAVRKAEGVSPTFKIPDRAEITYSVNEEDWLTVELGEGSEIYDGATLKIIPVGNNRGEAEIVRGEDGVYRLKPIKYATPSGGYEYTFRIMATDCLNYADKTSDAEYTVVLRPGTIVVGMDQKKNKYFYGAIINDETVVLEYYIDGEKIDPSTVSGFVKPTVVFDSEDLPASDELIKPIAVGGSSDGYVLETATDGTWGILVTPRVIDVTPASAIKTYGEEDPEIAVSIIIYEYVLDAEGNPQCDDKGNPLKNSDGNEILRQIETLPGGRQVVLNGAFGRETGELARTYSYNRGNLDEANGNYRIKIFNIENNNFTIRPRRVHLTVQAARKEYGDPDPDSYPIELDEGYEMGFDEDISVLGTVVERAAGENIGRYIYNVSTLTDNVNYEVVVDYVTNVFTITQAAVTAYGVTTVGRLVYGDRLDKLVLQGNFRDKTGNAVDGNFAWAEPESVLPGATTHVVSYMFIPNNRNYFTYNGMLEVTVAPRVADIHFEGSTRHIYSGEKQNDIVPTVTNAVAEEPELVLEEIGDFTNVGAHTLRIRLNDENYVFNGEYYEITVIIDPVLVVVGLESAVITEGDRYTPKFVYTGFVGGDDESVLTKKPQIGDVSTEIGGVYTIIPYGAEAENYYFDYTSGILRVNRLRLDSGDLTMKGNIPADVRMSFEKAGDGLLETNNKKFDKVLGYGTISPNSQKLSAYYDVTFTGKADGQFTYTVKLPLKSGDKVYAVFANGIIAEIDLETGELTEHNAQEIVAAMEGEEAADETPEPAGGLTEITFTAGQIVGIAVYSDKTFGETLLGYVPLIGIGAGVVVLVAIIIVAVVIVKAKDKKEKQQRRYFK